MDRYEDTFEEWIDQLEAGGGFEDIEDMLDELEELFTDADDDAFFDHVPGDTDADYGVGSPTRQSTTGVGSAIAHRRMLPDGVFENVVFPVGHQAQQGIQQQPGRRAQESIVDVSMPTPDGRRVNIEIDEQRGRMQAHIAGHLGAMRQAEGNFQRQTRDRKDPEARPISRSPVGTTRSAFVLRSRTDPNTVMEIHKTQYVRRGGRIVPRTETIRFPPGRRPSVQQVIDSDVLRTEVGAAHTLGGQRSIATLVRRVPAGKRARPQRGLRQRARRPTRRFDAFAGFFDTGAAF